MRIVIHRIVQRHPGLSVMTHALPAADRCRRSSVHIQIICRIICSFNVDAQPLGNKIELLAQLEIQIHVVCRCLVIAIAIIQTKTAHSGADRDEIA